MKGAGGQGIREIYIYIYEYMYVKRRGETKQRCTIITLINFVELIEQTKAPDKVQLLIGGGGMRERMK